MHVPGKQQKQVVDLGSVWWGLCVTRNMSSCNSAILVDVTQADSPRSRFYWGYIWDGTGNRHTAPIRNPRHKSHMPKEQVGGLEVLFVATQLRRSCRDLKEHAVGCSRVKTLVNEDGRG